MLYSLHPTFSACAAVRLWLSVKYYFYLDAALSLKRHGYYEGTLERASELIHHCSKTSDLPHDHCVLVLQFAELAQKFGFRSWPSVLSPIAVLVLLLFLRNCWVHITLDVLEHLSSDIRHFVKRPSRYLSHAVWNCTNDIGEKRPTFNPVLNYVAPSFVIVRAFCPLALLLYFFRPVRNLLLDVPWFVTAAR